MQVASRSEHDDKLLNPASNVCDVILEGHTGWVCAFAVLADGRLASGAADHTGRLWNPLRGMSEATLEGHTDDLYELVVLSFGT
jgi:WD40 repeat protein